MPELPDLTVYTTCLHRVAVGSRLLKLRHFNPFVLRSVEPKPAAFEGLELKGVTRLGKRLVFDFGEDRFAVVHLMIAGRFRWTAPGPAKPHKIVHAAFEFEPGNLMLTEASSKKRASITLVGSAHDLAKLDRGGLELFDTAKDGSLSPKVDEAAFRDRLFLENRTIKRALADPTLFAGIGNAYSDEILHAARLSPMRLTRSLKEDEVATLFGATLKTLEVWTAKLLSEFSRKFPGPGDITAFRPDFAVHGKFGQPCPVCGARIQRIAYADNETNYCAKCQNEGRLLADRALSRLLKDDWPKRLEDLSD